jgi:DNA-binding response OmpR family regulator
MFPNSKRFPISVIPVDEVPRQAAEDGAEPHRPVILVVDDETMIADSLTEILKRSGYAAIPAYDAESALETALVMPPEMLISDVALPGMNGIELATTVKRIFPECKIILSSGQSSTARLLTAADCAANHFVFLGKPVHPRELLDRVSVGLRRGGNAESAAAGFGLS